MTQASIVCPCSWNKHDTATHFNPQSHYIYFQLVFTMFYLFGGSIPSCQIQKSPQTQRQIHENAMKKLQMPHQYPWKSHQINHPPFSVTWWLIPLSKWVITPVINGISRVNPLVTGVITHLLSGMSHQVTLCFSQSPHLCYRKNPRINGAEAPSRSGSQARRTAAPSPDQRCDTSAAESDGRRPHEKSLKIPGISWCFYGNLRDFYGKIW